MNDRIYEALAALAIGAALGAWAIARIRSGKSYITNPPMRVTRKDDPFSFWLSLLPLIVVSLTLVAGGLYGLAISI